MELTPSPPCAIGSVAWNIGGLGDKLEALDLQHYLINFDVIILSETWLKAQV